MIKQNEPLPFFLNLTRPGMAGAPDSERVDKEATIKARQRLMKEHKGKLPQLAQGVHDALGSQLVTPSRREIIAIDRSRSDQGHRLCGECHFFDHASGQQYLANGGVEAISEKLGGPKACEFLGDWTKYGDCGCDGGLTDANGPKCKNYKDKRKTFGRILGGVWKRLNDI